MMARHAEVLQSRAPWELTWTTWSLRQPLKLATPTSVLAHGRVRQDRSHDRRSLASPRAGPRRRRRHRCLRSPTGTARGRWPTWPRRCLRRPSTADAARTGRRRRPQALPTSDSRARRRRASSTHTARPPSSRKRSDDLVRFDLGHPVLTLEERLRVGDRAAVAQQGGDAVAERFAALENGRRDLGQRAGRGDRLALEPFWRRGRQPARSERTMDAAGAAHPRPMSATSRTRTDPVAIRTVAHPCSSRRTKRSRPGSLTRPDARDGAGTWIVLHRCNGSSRAPVLACEGPCALGRGRWPDRGGRARGRARLGRHRGSRPRGRGHRRRPPDE